LLATIYAEAHYEVAPTKLLSERVGLRFDSQFTSQNSLGDELLADSRFHTWNIGLRVAASWRGFLARLGFAITGDGRRIESFYGSNPTFFSLMQRTLNEAGEKAVLASLSYDFSYIAMTNLSAIARLRSGMGG
jgi:hypothetical protein